jgi:hypothetical protein
MDSSDEIVLFVDYIIAYGKNEKDRGLSKKEKK